MAQISSHNIFYKKRARLWAILWTLLIFFLCFLPGNEIPNVKIPFIDKWTHFILFGVFAFLWLLSMRKINFRTLLIILLASILVGWLVEYIQGHLPMLHRSQDNMDTLADSIGGLLGVLVFYILFKIRQNRISN